MVGSQFSSCFLVGLIADRNLMQMTAVRRIAFIPTNVAIMSGRHVPVAIRSGHAPNPSTSRLTPLKSCWHFNPPCLKQQDPGRAPQALPVRQAPAVFPGQFAA